MAIKEVDDNEELFDMSIEIFKEMLEIDQLEIQELANDEEFIAYIKCIQRIGLTLTSKFIQQQKQHILQIQKLQQKNSDLHQKLTEQMNENYDLNQLLQYHINQRKMYDEELNKSEHQIQRGKNQIISEHQTKELLFQEKQRLALINEQLIKQNNKLQIDIQRITKHLADSQLINKQLKVQLGENKMKIQSSQQEINNLRQQLVCLQKENQSLNFVLEEKDFLLGNKLDEVKEDIPLSAEHNYPYYMRSIKVVKEENQHQHQHEYQHQQHYHQHEYKQKCYCDDKYALKDIQYNQQATFLLDFGNKSIGNSEDPLDNTDSVKMEFIEAPYGGSDSEAEHIIKSNQKNDVKLRPMKSDRKKNDTAEKEQVLNRNKSMIKTQQGSTKHKQKDIPKLPQTPKFKQPIGAKQKSLTSKIKRQYFESEQKISKSIIRHKNTSAQHKYPPKSNASVILNTKKDQNEASHFAPNLNKPPRLSSIQHSQSVENYFSSQIDLQPDYADLRKQLIQKQKVIQNLWLQNRSVRRLVQEQQQKRTQVQLEYEQTLQYERSLLRSNKQHLAYYFSKSIQQQSLRKAYQQQLAILSLKLQQQTKNYQKTVSDLKQSCIQQVERHRMMFEDKYEEVSSRMIKMQEDMRQMERIYLSNRNSSLGSSGDNGDEGGERSDSERSQRSSDVKRSAISGNNQQRNKKLMSSRNNLQEELMEVKSLEERKEILIIQEAKLLQHQQSPTRSQAARYSNHQQQQQSQDFLPKYYTSQQYPIPSSARSYSHHNYLFPKQVKYTSHNASREYSEIIPNLSRGDSKNTSALIDEEDTYAIGEERFIYRKDYAQERGVMEEQQSQEERGCFEDYDEGLFTRREKQINKQLTQYGTQTEQYLQEQLDQTTTLMYSHNYLAEEKDVYAQEQVSMELTTLVGMKSLEHSKIRPIYQVQYGASVQGNGLNSERLGYYQQVYSISVAVDKNESEDVCEQEKQQQQQQEYDHRHGQYQYDKSQQQQQSTNIVADQSVIIMIHNYNDNNNTKIINCYNQPSTMEISISTENRQSNNYLFQQHQHQQQQQQKQLQKQHQHSKQLTIVQEIFSLTIQPYAIHKSQISTETQTSKKIMIMLQKLQHITILSQRLQQKTPQKTNTQSQTQYQYQQQAISSMEASTQWQDQSQSSLVDKFVQSFAQTQKLELISTQMQFQALILMSAQTQSQVFEHISVQIQSQSLSLMSTQMQSQQLLLVSTYIQSQPLSLASTWVQSQALKLTQTYSQSQSFPLISTHIQSQLIHMVHQQTQSEQSFITTTMIDITIKSQPSQYPNLTSITAYNITINSSTNHPELKQTFTQSNQLQTNENEVQTIQEQQQQIQEILLCNANSQTEGINERLPILDHQKVVELKIESQIIVKQEKETQSTIIFHENAQSQTIRELLINKRQFSIHNVMKLSIINEQQVKMIIESEKQQMINKSNNVQLSLSLSIQQRQQQILQQSSYIDEWLNEWSESVDLGEGFIQLVKRKLLAIMENIKELEMAKSGQKNVDVEIGVEVEVVNQEVKQQQQNVEKYDEKQKGQLKHQQHQQQLQSQQQQLQLQLQQQPLQLQQQKQQQQQYNNQYNNENHKMAPMLTDHQHHGSNKHTLSSNAFFEGSTKQSKTSTTTNASSLSMSFQSPLLLTKQHGDGLILTMEQQKQKKISKFEQIKQQTRDVDKDKQQYIPKPTKIKRITNTINDNSNKFEEIIADHRSNYSGSVNRSEQQQQGQYIEKELNIYIQRKQQIQQEKKQLSILLLPSLQHSQMKPRTGKHLKPTHNNNIRLNKPQQLSHIITDKQFIVLIRQFKLIRKMQLKQSLVNNKSIITSVKGKLEINKLENNELFIIVVSSNHNTISNNNNKYNKQYSHNDVFILCQGKLFSLKHYYSFITHKLIQQQNQQMLVLGNQQIILSEDEFKLRMNNKINYFTGRYPLSVAYQDIQQIKGLTYNVEAVYKYIIK